MIPGLKNLRKVSSAPFFYLALVCLVPAVHTCHTRGLSVYPGLNVYQLISSHPEDKTSHIEISICYWKKGMDLLLLLY